MLLTVYWTQVGISEPMFQPPCFNRHEVVEKSTFRIRADILGMRNRTIPLIERGTKIEL